MEGNSLLQLRNRYFSETFFPGRVAAVIICLRRGVNGEQGVCLQPGRTSVRAPRRGATAGRGRVDRHRSPRFGGRAAERRK